MARPDVAKGLTVRFRDNLVDKVAVDWRQFVGQTQQEELSFCNGLIGIGRFDRSLTVQSTVFHKGEGAILGTGKVGKARLARRRLHKSCSKAS